MSKKSYYDVLDLKKDCTQDEIKKSYRKLAMEHHPDKGGDEAAFKEIAEAYESLSDPKTRQTYDSGGSRQAFQGFDVNNFFRNRNNDRPVGSNIILSVELTLEEVFSGTKKNFNYNRNKACEPCGGKGAKTTKVCDRCNGSGQVLETVSFGNSSIQLMNYCPSCNGSGMIPEDICESCKGAGVNLVSENITLDIPAGISEANTLNMSNNGHTAKGGDAGTLIIRFVELPHSIFTRHGNNLHQHLKLSYPQMVLGDTIELTTIEGIKIKLKIPDFSKVGDNLRIKGKGLKGLQKEDRGDLNIVLSIATPTSITDEERELISSLKKLNIENNLQ